MITGLCSHIPLEVIIRASNWIPVKIAVVALGESILGMTAGRETWIKQVWTQAVAKGAEK